MSSLLPEGEGGGSLVLEPIYIPRTANTGTCINRVCYLDDLFFFITRAHKGTCVSYTQRKEKPEIILGKNEVEWTRTAETRKDFLIAEEACNENLSRWVLSRGDLNFCIRSTPLMGNDVGMTRQNCSNVINPDTSGFSAKTTTRTKKARVRRNTDNCVSCLKACDKRTCERTS